MEEGINGFKEKIKEINEFYRKATTRDEWKSVGEKGNELEQEMEEAKRPLEEIATAILTGFWGGYYYVRNAETEIEIGNLPFLTRKVWRYYNLVENPVLKVEYGYLLSTIASELEENFDQAAKITKKIRKIADETGNVTLFLKVMNNRGLQHMKMRDFEEAVNVFKEICQFKEIPEEAFGVAGNIMSNSGASKIRGKMNKKDGFRDLVSALDYYLRVEGGPKLDHLRGVRNRMLEAFKP